MCQEARQNVLGFELAHIGINTADKDASMEVCQSLNAAFGLPIKQGNSSNFVSNSIEVMNSQYLGHNGHIAIRTNSIPRALAELEAKGYKADQSTAKFKGEKMVAIYLEQEMGGFAIHLLQK